MRLVSLAAGCLLSAFAGPLAAQPFCEGRNLVDALAAEEPARLAALEAKVAAVPNGEGRFWRVEKDGVAPSYLFGTMHTADPRVGDLPPEVLSAARSATTVAVELAEMFDPLRRIAVGQAMWARASVPQGGGLDGLPAGVADTVKVLASERGIATITVDRFRPWFLMLLIALPTCETRTEAAGQPAIDLIVAGEAVKAGARLVGLEQVDDQIGALESLDEGMARQSLVDTAALAPQLEDIFVTTLELYRTGRIAMIREFVRSLSPGEASGAAFAAFNERLVSIRNVKMAERALPLAAEGHAFIAVGALHLIDRDGLVEAFRRAGYRVTRIL